MIQVSTFVRLNLEFGFLYLQWHLFGFEVPSTYKCKQKPCPNIVDCFPSRPQEKTIFLYFMFLFSILCCVLNVCEFLELIWKLMKRCDCQWVACHCEQKNINILKTAELLWLWSPLSSRPSVLARGTTHGPSTVYPWSTKPWVTTQTYTHAHTPLLHTHYNTETLLWCHY